MGFHVDRECNQFTEEPSHDKVHFRERYWPILEKNRINVIIEYDEYT